MVSIGDDLMTYWTCDREEGAEIKRKKSTNQLVDIYNRLPLTFHLQCGSQFSLCDDDGVIVRTSIYSV